MHVLISLAISMCSILKLKLHNKGRLLRSEWTMIFSLLFVMLSLGIIAKMKTMDCSEQLQNPPPQTHEMCEVVIDGAVSRPGVFRVPPGTLLRKVIKKSGLRPNSNLRKLDLNQRVEESIHIHIEELSELSVTLEKEGEESIHFAVPLGTKVSDLKSLGLCSKKEASLLFKSRRQVRDGDVFSLRSSS